MGQPNLTVSHRPSAAPMCAPPPLRLAPRSVPLESLIKEPAGSQQACVIRTSRPEGKIHLLLPEVVVIFTFAGTGMEGEGG